MNDFHKKGLPGVTDILAERAAKRIEREVYGNIENFLDKCRAHLLNVYQKGKEFNIEYELSEYAFKEFPDLSSSFRQEIMVRIKNELTGYGVIQGLADDPDVTDIIAINHSRIVYEKKGVLKVAEAAFRSENHLRLFIERLCYFGKGKIDESRPSISLTMPEGYRVAIVIPPLASAPTFSMRKFVYTGNIDGLVKEGTFSDLAAQFLKLAIPGKVNMVFTGGMGTGKTTMISVLGHELSPMEMPLLIEEVRECPLPHPNLRNMVARPANIEGKGEIPFSHLLKVGLQSRASRVLVAEVRDGAAYYMLMAMFVGLLGSMGTFHADSPLDAVHSRLPGMLGQAPEMAGTSQSDKYRFLSSALQLIVQLARTVDGKRICTHISEVLKSSGEPPEVRDIFIHKDGKLVPTGYIPERILGNMAQFHINVPRHLFRKES